MQASKIFYPGKIFFMQAIKKKIVYTSTFFRLYKPLACINHTLKKHKTILVKLYLPSTLNKN